MRFGLFTLVFMMLSALVWAEGDSSHETFTPAFRLTCLPGQNFATLESLWLERLPDKAVEDFTQAMARQGVYVPPPLSHPEENIQLQASCSVAGHTVNVRMSGNGEITPAAIRANDGRDFNYTDCPRVMNLTLESLDVDSVKWHSRTAFADACLDPNILRMRIYPQQRRMEVCTQAVGGLLENGLPDVWYSDIPVASEERANPSTPKVTCQTINIPRTSK